MRSISLLGLAALALAGACSGSEVAPPPAVAHDAEGSWGMNNHGVVIPGNTFLIAMTEKSGTINRDQIDGQLTRDGSSSTISLIRLEPTDPPSGAALFYP